MRSDSFTQCAKVNGLLRHRRCVYAHQETRRQAPEGNDDISIAAAMPNSPDSARRWWTQQGATRIEHSRQIGRGSHLRSRVIAKLPVSISRNLKRRCGSGRGRPPEHGKLTQFIPRCAPSSYSAMLRQSPVCVDKFPDGTLVCKTPAGARSGFLPR